MSYNWKKKGLIFDVKKNALPSFAKHSVLQPTPILLDGGEIIRFYAGMRDELGQSRIGFIDVLSSNPKEIVNISKEPALDIGQDGFFDDAGVVPSAITCVGKKYYLYFAGYSLLSKVRFSVLGGLAESSDGISFTRVSSCPVFERCPSHELFRVPHSIIKCGESYKIWYGAGNHFFKMNDYTYPVYDIYHCETDDLSKIPLSSPPVLSFENNDEYRVARPYVTLSGSKYIMFLCVATKSKGYRLGYAESSDGVTWNRCDDKLNITTSETGWDSEMMGYPSFVKTKYGDYLFYNGNEYGKRGFGYAKLHLED